MDFFVIIQFLGGFVCSYEPFVVIKFLGGLVQFYNEEQKIQKQIP
jgi:hypothetical protein